MKIAFIGQPNCGKSTIFNYFSGYKAAVSNFPGTTVKYTLSQVVFQGEAITCVDLPGGPFPHLHRRGRAGIEELPAVRRGRRHYQRHRRLSFEPQPGTHPGADESRAPHGVALNMMDEAHRKGISIDAGNSGTPGGPGGAHRSRAGRGLTELLEKRRPGKRKCGRPRFSSARTWSRRSPTSVTAWTAAHP